MHLGYIVLIVYLVFFNVNASKLIMKGPELVLNFHIMAVIGNKVFGKIFDCKGKLNWSGPMYKTT